LIGISLKIPTEAKDQNAKKANIIGGAPAMEEFGIALGMLLKTPTEAKDQNAKTA